MATDLHAHAGTPLGGHARGWLLGVGLLALLLGSVGLYVTIAFIVVGLAWYGLLLIVAGIVQAAEAIAVPPQPTVGCRAFCGSCSGCSTLRPGFMRCSSPPGQGWR